MVSLELRADACCMSLKLDRQVSYQRLACAILQPEGSNPSDQQPGGLMPASWQAPMQAYRRRVLNVCKFAEPAGAAS